jgi:hypothetical protein
MICPDSSFKTICFLSLRQYTNEPPKYSNEQPKPAVPLSQFTACKVSHPVRWLMFDVHHHILFPKNFKIYFFPSQLIMLLAFISPCKLCCKSFRFSPPDCYQLSQAGISSLLRIHLPPHTASFDLGLPLVSPLFNIQPLRH